jgi:hypothetical protein
MFSEYQLQTNTGHCFQIGMCRCFLGITDVLVVNNKCLDVTGADLPPVKLYS